MKIWPFAVAGIVLAGGLIWGCRHRDVRASPQQLADDWASVERCMLGAPLAHGETSSQRFRAIELGDGNADHTWRGRCTKLLAALVSEAPPALGAAARAAMYDLSGWDTRDLFTDLAAQIAALALPTGHADEAVVAAPPPVALLPMPRALAVQSSGVRVTWSSSRRTAWLVSDFQVCTFAPDATGAPLTTFACTQLGEALRSDESRLLTPGGAADGAPLPLLVEQVGDHPDAAVWLVGADKPVARVRARQMYAWSADAVDLVVADPAGFAIQRHRAGAVTRTVIPMKRAENSEIVLGAGAVYYVESHRDGAHLRAILFDRDHPPVPASAADLGILADADNFYDSTARCDLGRTHAITSMHTIAIAIDGQWSAPIPLDAFGPTSCDDTGVTIVDEKPGGFDRIRCDPASCTHQAITVATHSTVSGGNIGHFVLLAWRGSLGDPIGEGVRIRFATPDAFATAPDRVLVDNADISSVDALAGAGAAVIMLSHGNVMSAFRIDETGAITPVSK